LDFFVGTAKGSNSESGTTLPSATTTPVVQFSASTWRINSLHRPQGGRMVPRVSTATMATIRVCRCLSISAMAACSAQKPKLDCVSMHIPVKTAPVAVSKAADTLPAVQWSEHTKSPTTAIAAAFNALGSNVRMAIPYSLCPPSIIMKRPMRGNMATGLGGDPCTRFPASIAFR